MDAERRLTQAIVKAAYEQAVEQGVAMFFDDRIAEVAEQVGATPQQVRQVQREMRDAYLLVERSPRLFRATERLLLEYETTDREAAYRQNEVRRWILQAVGELDARAKGAGLIQFKPDGDDPYPPAEQYLAAVTLAYIGFLEMTDEGRPGIFSVKLGTRGYDALRDENLLRATLPINLTEDQEAQITVAPDALGQIIASCEEILEALGWKQVLVELGRGDKEYRDGGWVNAVREYYAAIESGLQYALGIGAEPPSEEHRALRRLAGKAGRAAVIPVNYEALFGFTDSIRSPRSHGAAGRADTVGEVEVGQAEALLMGNHARTLLLYLGQRASVLQS
jgi:hypothetical protein